jgi:DNA mismatch endonuclease (patch repair protein)
LRAPAGRKQPQLSANRTRDRLITRTLRTLGWRVLRLWEHELTRKNEPRLVRRLLSHLERTA